MTRWVRTAVDIIAFEGLVKVVLEAAFLLGFGAQFALVGFTLSLFLLGPMHLIDFVSKLLGAPVVLSTGNSCSTAALGERLSVHLSF